MKQTIKATFTLTEKEIRIALYDFFVRKLKANNVGELFSEDDIEIHVEHSDLEVNLKFNTNKTLE